MRRLLTHTLIAAAVLAAGTHAACAHPNNLAEASALSMLPVAVSVAAPIVIVAGGAMLTVVAIEASATGTVWVLERASDGARASLRLSTAAAAELSVAVGTTVSVVAFSAGCILVSAGKAIAYIPNEIGTALLYNERVTR